MAIKIIKRLSDEMSIIEDTTVKEIRSIYSPNLRFSFIVSLCEYKIAVEIKIMNAEKKLFINEEEIRYELQEKLEYDIIRANAISIDVRVISNVSFLFFFSTHTISDKKAPNTIVVIAIIVCVNIILKLH
ncbi:MAG: hypothetical protein ACP5IO_01090 [Elusimicrobiales bacterium]